MADWYGDGHKMVVNKVAEVCGISFDKALLAYATIEAFELIDYDTEKEVFWDLTEGGDIGCSN